MRTTTRTTRARRSLMLLLAMLAALGLLAGCGSSDSGSDGDGAKASDDETTVEESEATVEVTIVRINPTTTTEAPAETTTTDKAATTTTTAAPTPEITSIQFATSLEPSGAAVDPTTTFAADEATIYASVLVKSLPKGAVIEGDFDAAGSKLPATSFTADEDYAEEYVQFALKSGGSFEPGTYTFATTIDGKAGPQLDFTIE